MKSWICPRGHKNDIDDATCYLCGAASTVKPKEEKGIKKASDHRANQLAKYNAEVEKWKKGKCCVMCDWEGKKNTNITCHHMQGKEGALLLDKSKWVPLCIVHHVWVSEHSKEAIELGISLLRNSTPGI